MIGCLLAYLQEFLETWFLKRHNDKMYEKHVDGVSNQFRQNRITTHDDKWLKNSGKNNVLKNYITAPRFCSCIKRMALSVSLRLLSGLECVSKLAMFQTK